MERRAAHSKLAFGASFNNLPGNYCAVFPREQTVLLASVSADFSTVVQTSRLRAEHRELGVLEHEVVARKADAVGALQVGDVATAHDLPGALLANVIGQLLELTVPATCTWSET